MMDPLSEPTAMPTAVSAAGRERLAAPPLAGDAQADVVVVGGGFTGISAALHLAEAGKAVILLEAREVAWGASGRCYGQVVPYAKIGPEQILAKFPGARGERIIAALGEGPDLVYGLIEAHGIDCAAERRGMMVAAHAPKARARIEAVVRYWQGRGAPVEMIEGRALEEATGTRFYRSAYIDRRAGLIDPPALVRGLARAAAARGVEFHEGTRVTDLVRRGGDWRVVTPHGAVACASVVLATNAYVGALWPRLARAMVPARMYQLVSETLPRDLQARILPARVPLMDTGHLFSSLRLRCDGRLHISSDGTAFSLAGQPKTGKTERRLRRLYPEAPPFRWAERWSGIIAIVPDLFPRLHELEPDLWAAYGYCGRGIAFGTLMGREIARRIIGGRNDEALLPVSPLRPMAAPDLAPLVVRAMMQWYRLSDWWEGRALRRAAAG